MEVAAAQQQEITPALAVVVALEKLAKPAKQPSAEKAVMGSSPQLLAPPRITAAVVAAVSIQGSREQ